MKALVYTGPESLEIRDVLPPSHKAGEVPVRVESAGICGSDMHAFLGHDERRPAPLILGHEVAGVAEMPDGSRQRVTINPLVTCGTCRACKAGQDNLCPERQIISMPPREGGFAEWVALPERNLVAVPDHISPDQAALAEPIACGWHAARIARAHPAGARDGARALVFGGGAIGLGAALSLMAQGITDVRLVEPNLARARYLSERCGVTVIKAEAATQRHYDVIVDGVGIAPTRAAASAAARPGGIIVHIGLGSSEGGLDIRRMTLQEITFTGTYTYTAQDFRDCAQAMFDGRLGPLDWVERRPLSEGASAFADIRAGRTAAPKIILKPDA
ncbi:zinc-dependent alcohol dehydrogenase [Pseudoruegeria sp. SHC-113]|uniref:zinc-dependent alcohol dehydrogenase n=1 Tax=Pseudoruegeria sp. SHC-113 TaxID=2855439 RepID=UPI0021BA3E5F|nr:alcohol dehydrogenase catalytic domain-containing protein [Pseudoruegeria sp. SHC-113]MCT8159489.1 alcohol dehydrogenase catalytic domain-containing protein [Pseudoruegeria sp. SHC-113]